MIKIFTLLLFLLIIFGNNSFAKLYRCKVFEQKVRVAHYYFFGDNYPYWFSLGQLYVESNCRWVQSKDGFGSIGYAQITPRFWDKKLKKLFPAWKVKNSFDYFFAHAYILYLMHKKNPCGKLYITYQCYNRSCYKVIKENKKQCNWQCGYLTCMKKYNKKICVWRKNGKCLQYKYSCDINYEYSKKVYKYGKKFQILNSKKFIFW